LERELLLDLPAWEELDLAYTAIDDQALEYLAQCEYLDYLDLTGTDVTPRAIEELPQRLPDCSIITEDDETQQSMCRGPAESPENLT